MRPTRAQSLVVALLTVAALTATSSSAVFAAGNKSASGQQNPLDDQSGGKKKGKAYETEGITNDAIVIASDQLGDRPFPYGDFDLGVRGLFESVNANGGIHGRKIDYRPFETNFDATKVLTECRRAVEEDKPFAFAGDNPIVVGDSCYDLLGKLGIPVVGTDGISFQSWAYPTAFNLTLDIYNFYRASAFWAAKLQPKPKKLAAIFSGGTPAFDKTAEATVELARKMGVRDVLDPILLPPTQSDFTDTVARLKSENVDTVILAHSPVSVVQILKTMQEQNYHPRIVLGMQTHDPRFTPAYAPYLEPDQEMYLPAQTYLPETGGGGTFDEYAADAKAIKPDGNLFSQGFQAWAGAKLLVDALEAIGPKPTRTKLVNYLNKLKDYDPGISPDRFTWPAKKKDRFVPRQSFLAKYDVAKATWTAPGGSFDWTDKGWTAKVPQDVRG
jgi:ABC-type branched-subunit amino acid transport system substrate-binding protein